MTEDAVTDGIDGIDDEATPWYEDLVMPVLLDVGRRTYGAAMRRDLAAAGFDDLPRLGPRLVGGIARNGTGLTEFSRAIGTSKQRAGQLVDTCVARGYLERRPHPDDGRRVVIALTPRGAAAADVIRQAIESTDAALAAVVGGEAVAAARRVIGALAGLDDQHD
jgi:DNA-binding MarR family transcriptional regulator